MGDVGYGGCKPRIKGIVVWPMLFSLIFADV